ncbi:MAG: M56 family metallopeptidase [Acidobacteriaceae bacterium]
MNSVAWESLVVPLLHHLWQSTVFAGGVWLLALALRRNAARVRYRLWMAASLKFLVPFSLLMALGARLPWPAHLERTQPAIAAAVEGVAQPLLVPWPVTVDSGFAAGARVEHPATDWLPLALVVLWVAGTLLLLGRWTASWLQLRAAVRRGEPMTLADGTQSRLMAEKVEPGIFGIVRPVLVLPRGIAERLSAEQLDAIVAHEMCHLRRRDNLTAALHMIVEALFWFHPLVWWLRARLVEERERACDEAVLDATRQPFAYAEGILTVCKFYVEAPLSCVSGVTGSELKQRIARILSGQGVRKLDVGRKALLALACVLAAGIPVTAGLVRAAQAQWQVKGGIAGTWQGTAHLPNDRDSRFVLTITKDEKGALSATMYDLDQPGPPMGGSSVTFAAGTLRFTNIFPGLSFEGKMSADGNSISGTAIQNGTFSLVLERATPETAWATPAAPPRMPPMPPDAKPDFEVATIKPSQPGSRRFMLSMRGADLAIANFSLNDLIKFAYDVQSSQIVEGPSWTRTDRWDVDAKPDTPGMPSQSQLREMVQKLLAERFSLKIREENREMAAYALTTGKDGPKLTKSANASGLGGFSMGPLGTLHAGGATMVDFTHVLGDVFGQPVVDKTGLQGRWDFTLRWTPDDTQFGAMGMRVPPPAADDANAPPPLFTAIQEQLGLKLESEKADVPVLVIDHVDHPSPN